MLAMLRTVKASPGCRPRVTDGQQRESAQANTMNCTPTQQIKLTLMDGRLEYTRLGHEGKAAHF
jgi:hypothetical protein